MKTVVFQLHAPICSFGGVTAGEFRPTESAPTHSALAGVINACLGFGKENPKALIMANSVAFASRVENVGGALIDFHVSRTATAENPTAFEWQKLIRSEEGVSKLSRRAYLTDFKATICVMVGDIAPANAEQIVQSLKTPVYAPYVGRKSCPLGAPPAAAIISAETLSDAFAQYDAARNRKDISGDVFIDDAFMVHGLVDGSQITRTHSRRDLPASGRTFSFRREHVIAA